MSWILRCACGVDGYDGDDVVDVPCPRWVLACVATPAAERGVALLGGRRVPKRPIPYKWKERKTRVAEELARCGYCWGTGGQFASTSCEYGGGIGRLWEHSGRRAVPDHTLALGTHNETVHAG